MNHDIVESKPPYKMEFDPATIKHLGFQISYSNSISILWTIL